MMPTLTELRPRSTSEVFNLALRLYLQRFPHAVAVTAIVLVPTLLLSELAEALWPMQAALLGIIMPSAGLQETPFQSIIPATDTSAALLSTCLLILGLIAGIFWPWAEGALALSTLEQLLGNRIGLRDAYGRTRRRWPSLWLANLLAQIGIALPLAVAGLSVAGVALISLMILGFAFESADAFDLIPSETFIIVAALGVPLFIVALIIAITLAVNWSMRAPAIVHEDQDGIAGLGRSIALVRGHRGRIFGRYLLFAFFEFLLTLLLPIAISLPIAIYLLPQASALPREVDPQATTIVSTSAMAGTISAVITLFVTPLRVIFTVVNYADLRIRKGELLVAQEERVDSTIAKTATESLSSYTIPQSLGVDWRMSDPARMTPAQRVSFLFKRIRTEGETPELLMEMGFALYEVGDWGNALNALTRAHELSPKNPRIVYGLMMLYHERRDLTLARQMMQTYLQLETDPEALRSTRNNPRFRDLL
jgi:hypothetical protein